MQIVERGLCWHKCADTYNYYINNDKGHFMSVVKRNWSNAFTVRYVRNYQTELQIPTDITNLEEAKAFIIQETLKYLQRVASHYSELYKLVEQETNYVS
jgi:hypothetical protein